MYRLESNVPPLVKRAVNLAEQMHHAITCSLEAGRLLQLLASHLQSGVVGEVGTGCGVAAAWIVSSLSAGTSFFTVESDPAQAAAASALFGSLLNVRVVQGDWRELLGNWHFSLLYAGKASPRAEEPEMFVRALRLGGMLVLDGLTPQDRVPLELRAQLDPIREFFFNDSRLLATEILVSSQEAVLLATFLD